MCEIEVEHAKGFWVLQSNVALTEEGEVRKCVCGDNLMAVFGVYLWMVYVPIKFCVSDKALFFLFSWLLMYMSLKAINNLSIIFFIFIFENTNKCF